VCGNDTLCPLHSPHTNNTYAKQAWLAFAARTHRARSARLGVHCTMHGCIKNKATVEGKGRGTRPPHRVRRCPHQLAALDRDGRPAWMQRPRDTGRAAVLLPPVQIQTRSESHERHYIFNCADVGTLRRIIVLIQTTFEVVQREIMLFIGKPKGRSRMISNSRVEQNVKLAR